LNEFLGKIGMLFEELQAKVKGSSDVGFLYSHRTSTPAWLVRNGSEDK